MRREPGAEARAYPRRGGQIGGQREEEPPLRGDRSATQIVLLAGRDHSAQCAPDGRRPHALAAERGITRMPHPKCANGCRRPTVDRRRLSSASREDAVSVEPLPSLDRSTLRERALEPLRAAITSGQLPARGPPRRGGAGDTPRREPGDGPRGAAPPPAGGAGHRGQPRDAAGEHGVAEGGPRAVPRARGAGRARRQPRSSPRRGGTRRWRPCARRWTSSPTPTGRTSRRTWRPTSASTSCCARCRATRCWWRPGATSRVESGSRS